MTDDVVVIYKIRSKVNGQFSTGGAEPHWSKAGKVWRTRAALSLHFSQLYRRGQEIYAEHQAEVIEYVTIESLVTPATEFILAAKQRKAEREDASRERVRKYREEIERREYERLKARFEPK